jgi:hypothetical protein
MARAYLRLLLEEEEEEEEKHMGYSLSAVLCCW